MSTDSSPNQTPTVSTMSGRNQQSSNLRTPLAPLRPFAGPSPLSTSNPTTPETATFANTAVKKAPESEEPLPPAAAPVRTKARDLLRQHYGMALGPPAPLPGRPDDPMDIDSSAFDAKAYYNQLITTTSLTGLLKRENELYAEIRKLDSERQSLVYNHHHELIAASDTIRAMKSRADSLDVDLEKLRAAFSEISRLSAEVTKDAESNSV